VRYVEASAIAFLIFGWGVILGLMAWSLSRLLKAGVKLQPAEEEK